MADLKVRELDDSAAEFFRPRAKQAARSSRSAAVARRGGTADRAFARRAARRSNLVQILEEASG